MPPSDGRSAKFDPRHAVGRLLLNDGATQKRITLEGAGISINSMWLVHDALKDGTLLRVLPDYEVADTPSLWLIYPKSNVVSAKVRALIDFLIEHVGRAPKWTEPS
ncbi:LysR substrate-binding domain-containing protein [Cognatishimia coralii]|uniref:LysR substrate-binding domain-containing protein n=1 Tax=Cognatishimia coralii TaxID=3083254 RepID=UPI0034DB6201